MATGDPGGYREAIADLNDAMETTPPRWFRSIAGDAYGWWSKPTEVRMAAKSERQVVRWNRVPTLEEAGSSWVMFCNFVVGVNGEKSEAIGAYVSFPHKPDEAELLNGVRYLVESAVDQVVNAPSLMVLKTP